MAKSPPTIFLSAAEASGDAHAAKLIKALRQKLPAARFVGVGGPKMAQAGCEMVCQELGDLTRQASMLFGPFFKLRFYHRAVRKLQKAIAAIKPDIHVPVDSPALNWHLAKAAKAAGAKVVYFIAPQVWAWAPWRIEKIKRLTDCVACVLPFEADWLTERGAAGRYVGHPLFDDIPTRPDPLPDILDAWSTGQWRVLLLPGSRPAEIRNHTKALGGAAEAICKRWPAAKCTFAAVDDSAAKTIIGRLNRERREKYEIAAGRTEDLLAESHFAIAASGTITLEIAYFGVPMIVFYKVSRFSYNLVGRWLLRTPHLSLVNILAARSHAKRIVPELMPWYGSKGKLNSMALEVMDDPGWLIQARGELLELTDSMITPGRNASAAAAELIAEILER